MPSRRLSACRLPSTVGSHNDGRAMVRTNSKTDSCSPWLFGPCCGGDRHEVHQVEACEVSEGAIAAALDKEANGGSQKLELERTALCAQWCRVCDHFERQQQNSSEN